MPAWSASVRLALLSVVVGAALGLCATPALAKKAHDKDTTDVGGLFHAPSPIPRPTLILDSTAPPQAAEEGAQTAAATAPRPARLASPPKPLEPARPAWSIADLRLHLLFE